MPFFPLFANVPSSPLSNRISSIVVIVIFPQLFNWLGKRQKSNSDLDAKGGQMLTELLLNLQTAHTFSEQKGG
jgi:hypothetical protein